MKNIIKFAIGGLGLVTVIAFAEPQVAVKGDGLVMNTTATDFVVSDTTDVKAFPNVNAGQTAPYTLPTDQTNTFMITYANKVNPEERCVFSFHGTAGSNPSAVTWKITAQKFGQVYSCSVDTNNNLIIGN